MTGHATELANLDKTRQAHIAALNAGDAHRWAACFAADAVQMPPNDPPNAGAESIRAWSAAFLAAFAVKFSLRPDEVTLTGADWPSNAAPTRSPSPPQPAARRSTTPASTSRSTSDTPTTPGSLPATSGTATTRRQPRLPHD